jgi:hypothetical protein
VKSGFYREMPTLLLPSCGKWEKKEENDLTHGRRKKYR